MTELVTRAYNSFEHDHFIGALKKISKDGKLRDELSYYECVPTAFRTFFPRLLGYGNDWILLERYDYPNLGEYVLGQTDYPLHPSDWKEVMEHLRAIVDKWRKFPGKNAMTKMEDAYAIYISKTAREYTAFKEQNVWPGVFESETLVINGVEQKNFSTLWPETQAYIQNTLIPSYHSSFIHGDFCLCNILYGDRGTLRFIDPRGSFGTKGIFGDIRYDVAKLYHSVDGAYESLNNNKFGAAHLGSNVWGYEIASIAPWRSRIEALEAFNDHFFGGPNPFSVKEITLIEGLIFVGACARHYENADRQLALYLIGIERLNRAMAL